MKLSERFAPLNGINAQKDPPSQVIEWGEWLPDLPDLANPGCLIANGVFPGTLSYEPFQDLTVQSDALDNYCRGGASVKRASDGAEFFYCGDELKLYQIRDQLATDKSKVGGYGCLEEDYWEFVQFGDNVIATNFTDPVQGIPAGDPGVFADHFTSTAKPRMRTIAVVRDFLVGGYVHDGSGLIPNRVQWSALGDSMDMDPDAQTQADFQDIASGGQVQKVVGGVEYGVVFLDKAIYRMAYVGSPIIFQFDAVDRIRGTSFPRTVCPLGRNIFYWSEEGFFVFDGSASQPLGHGKVDRWFLDQIDPARPERFSCAVDYERNLIVTAFAGTGSTNDPNLLLFYNYKDNKFAYAEVDTQVVVSAATQAYTLEGLDPLYPTLEDVPSSLDSSDWKGGAFRLAAFNTLNQQCFFTGQNLPVTMVSGERQMAAGRVCNIESVRPLAMGTNITESVSVGSRDLQSEQAQFGPDDTPSADGLTNHRNKARYHRFRHKIFAGSTWEHLQGVEVKFRPSGTRQYG